MGTIAIAMLHDRVALETIVLECPLSTVVAGDIVICECLREEYLFNRSRRATRVTRMFWQVKEMVVQELDGMGGAV
jgi:hypothetical protein